MAGSWIKLHRRILNHWVFADDAAFYLWMNLLMRANWKPGKFWSRGASAPVIVQRGQLITGRNSLHALLYPERDSDGHLIKRDRKPPHPTTLWRWLEAMEKDGMIAMEVRSKFTIITICKYDTYQNMKPRSAQGSAPQVRQSCAAGAPQVRTIEEVKEGEEDKNSMGRKRRAVFVPPNLEEVKTYCDSRSNGIDPQVFIDHYEANGWVQGNRGKPIKSWQAAVRTWEYRRAAEPRKETLDELYPLKNGVPRK